MNCRTLNIISSYIIKNDLSLKYSCFFVPYTNDKLIIHNKEFNTFKTIIIKKSSIKYLLKNTTDTPPPPPEVKNGSPITKDDIKRIGDEWQKKSTYTNRSMADYPQGMGKPQEFKLNLYNATYDAFGNVMKGYNEPGILQVRDNNAPLLVKSAEIGQNKDNIRGIIHQKTFEYQAQIQNELVAQMAIANEINMAILKSTEAGKNITIDGKSLNKQLISNARQNYGVGKNTTNVAL